MNNKQYSYTNYRLQFMRDMDNDIGNTHNNKGS